MRKQFACKERVSLKKKEHINILFKETAYLYVTYLMSSLYTGRLFQLLPLYYTIQGVISEITVEFSKHILRISWIQRSLRKFTDFFSFLFSSYLLLVTLKGYASCTERVGDSRVLALETLPDICPNKRSLLKERFEFHVGFSCTGLQHQFVPTIFKTLTKSYIGLRRHDYDWTRF